MVKDAIRPRVIVLASSKGGQGKSVLATALAARASKDGRTALVDYEPQGSASIWWKLRGKPENPAIHVSNHLPEDIAYLKGIGMHTIVVDTPPLLLDAIDQAIEVADLVVIPSRVGLFDLGGIRPTIALCQRHRRPMLFVLNSIGPDEPHWKRLTKGAATVLKQQEGGTLLARMIRERPAYVSALNRGLSAAEHPDPKQAKPAAAEIEAVWTAVKKMARAR